MYKSEWNIMEKLEPMLVGKQLKDKMAIFPDYEENIRRESASVRLLELNKINSFYLPSDMSVEIYTKLYLAMVKSLQKKESKLAIQQRNLNGENLRVCANGTPPSFGGIIGGSDSFSIIGCSGIGKTSAIQKAIELMGGENIIEMEHPFCRIIPVISVQCPFDCSAKSMLLSILKRIDTSLGTSYYEKMVKAKANINTMLISTAQVLLNHVAVLCIDEIQNLIKHRAGMQLVSMLTELLNESGISIVFVGTPEIKPFFESEDYLARRTLGLSYSKCEYNVYFKRFCNTLWKFQYVKQYEELTESVTNWLYQHSSGILAHVIFLFYTSQEISILDGREIIDIQALESTYQRMEMLHMHVQPEVSMKKIASKRKKHTSMKGISENIEKKEKNVMETDLAEVHPIGNGTDMKWSFVELMKEAKKCNVDMVDLLHGKISITEVAV